MDKSVGENTNIGGQNIFVQETGIFKLVSIKGFVNNLLIPGKQYEYLDGIIDGKVMQFEKEIGNDRIRVIREV